MEQFLVLMKKFNLAQISGVASISGTNQLFLLLVLIFIFLYGISVGKTRAVLSLLAMYVAFMLTNAFPYFKVIAPKLPEQINAGLIQIIAFVVFYIFTSFVLNTSSLKSRLSLGEISFAKVFVISIFQVGFLASILFYLLPKEILPSNLMGVYQYVGTQGALFIWALIALLILPFMKNGKKD
jgi:hypothetical protein